ncbi:MAG: FtsX-like permease family protein, partial [Vicinamibacteria bacterium]
NLHVATAGPPMEVLPAVREAIRSIDNDLPLYDARPIGEERAILLVRQRSVGALLGASALLALVLAAVGTYGVTAQQVARRAPELGLRMALGAQRADILRFVFRLGLVPVVLGAALGLALSSQAGKAVSSLLIGVDAADAPTFAAAGLVAILCAAAACWVPAARASRIDPAAALRGE